MAYFNSDMLTRASKAYAAIDTWLEPRCHMDTERLVKVTGSHGNTSETVHDRDIAATGDYQQAMYRWRGGATGLAISRSRVQNLLEATLRNNLRQVVYTYMPPSPSSITWYRPKGGDALRLGR